MKILSGSEIVGYIKERQAKQVRVLRQSSHVMPKLAIIQTIDDSVISTYVGLKQRYGEDIFVEVETHHPKPSEVMSLIDQLNDDPSVHGIIVQLPLFKDAPIDIILEHVAKEKDVDGLGSGLIYDPATPLAINWLTAGYSVELAQKNILIIGNGRLVGAPLARMWKNSGYHVTVVDDTVKDLKKETLEADVIVTAAGVAGLITSDMVRPDSAVIDAGTSSEGGAIVGDVADDVRERSDVSITPIRGGVGPLTVAALFDNVIRAAQATVTKA